MAEEIINDVDENGFEIIDTPIQEALDLSNLATFLKEAIATDTAIEYTVPLNDDSSFINAHYYDPDKGEDFITEAKVNVTVLEHLYNPSVLLSEYLNQFFFDIAMLCAVESYWFHG